MQLIQSVARSDQSCQSYDHWQDGYANGLRTIAKYSESDEIASRLRVLGVDYAQEFGISHPRPLDEIGSG